MSFFKAKLEPDHAPFAIDRNSIETLNQIPGPNGTGTWSLKTKNGVMWTLTGESGWMLYNNLNCDKPIIFS